MHTCFSQSLNPCYVRIVALAVMIVWGMTAGPSAHAQNGCASRIGAGGGGGAGRLAGGAAGGGGAGRAAQFQQQAFAQIQQQVFLRQQAQRAQQQQFAIERSRQLQQTRATARREEMQQATAAKDSIGDTQRPLTRAEKTAKRRAVYLRWRQDKDADRLPTDIAQDSDVPASTPVATTGPSA